MNRNGIFKYRVDQWPVGVVFFATALSLVPFFVHMPIWGLAINLAAVIYVRTFCPFAQHNHGHLPVFNSKILNWTYDALLAQNTGYPTALWELHHNRGHHRNFLTPEKDVAALTYPGTNKLMSRWMYALRGNLTIHRDSIRTGIQEGKEGKKTLLGKLAFETLVQTVLTLALLAWNPWLAVAFFIVPNLFSSWMVWWESYPHHLNMPTTTLYDSSMTVEKKSYNRMTFNIGHHTAHHEKPTLHWSLLPQRTAAIRDRIHEACIKADYTTAGSRFSLGTKKANDERAPLESPIDLASFKSQISGLHEQGQG